LLLIAALLDVAGGSDVEVPVAALTAGADAPARELRQGPAAATGRWVGPRYEVMFLLRADDVDELRARWEAIGESIVVVGGDGMWNCHIHTDLVGPAIEAGVEAGTPSRIRVTDLREEAGDPGVHDAPF